MIIIIFGTVLGTNIGVWYAEFMVRFVVGCTYINVKTSTCKCFVCFVD
jgi:uncharacterized membrane protein